MKYKNIYNFEVFSEIANGETVYALDRAERTIDWVNNMVVCDAVSLVQDAYKDKERFEFWVEEEATEVTEEEENA